MKGDSTATATTGAPARLRTSRPDVRIALLTIGTAIATLAVQLALPDRGGWSYSHDAVAVSVITLMSVATEGFTINLRAGT